MEVFRFFPWLVRPCFLILIRVEPDTRLKRVSGTDISTFAEYEYLRVIRVNICARIEYKFSLGSGLCLRL